MKKKKLLICHQGIRQRHLSQHLESYTLEEKHSLLLSINFQQIKKLF